MFQSFFSSFLILLFFWVARSSSYQSNRNCLLAEFFYFFHFSHLLPFFASWVSIKSSYHSLYIRFPLESLSFLLLRFLIWYWVSFCYCNAVEFNRKVTKAFFSLIVMDLKSKENFMMKIIINLQHHHIFICIPCRDFLSRGIYFFEFLSFLSKHESNSSFYLTKSKVNLFVKCFVLNLDRPRAHLKPRGFYFTKKIKSSFFSICEWMRKFSLEGEQSASHSHNKSSPQGLNFFSLLTISFHFHNIFLSCCVCVCVCVSTLRKLCFQFSFSRFRLVDIRLLLLRINKI